LFSISFIFTYELEKKINIFIRANLEIYLNYSCVYIFINV